MSRNTYIDADSIVYIIASGFKQPYQWKQHIQCRARVNEFVEDILIATNADKYMGFVGEGRNFRYNIAVTKPYKANRGPKEDFIAHWDPIIKAHLKEKWGFKSVSELEVDDAVIIMWYHHNGGTIASPDKDLRQIPGKVYDYGKRETHYLDQETAARNLYTQLLTGDSTDNIPGCPGVGPGAASKVLADHHTPYSIFMAAVRHFITHVRDVIPEKERGKAEKAYLDQYKKDNNIKRFTKKLKLEALENYDEPDTTVPTMKEIKTLIREQLALVQMLRKPEFGFEIPNLLDVPDKVKKKEEVVKEELPKKKESKLDKLLDL